MFQSIEFTEEWRCFKAGTRFDFRPGVNLLVGDQGSGKSSLIAALQSVGMKNPPHKFEHLQKTTKVKATACKTFSFDFEKDNVRMQSHFSKNIMFQMVSMHKSHGETNVAMLNSLQEAADCVVMMDEPDMALSIRTCAMLVKRFKELEARGSQVIAAVHNPIVIQAFKDVLSLEHCRWVPSKDFVAIHLACEHCGCHPCGCGG
jgi:predicted ATPase